jgi:hypothetical protein
MDRDLKTAYGALRKESAQKSALRSQLTKFERLGLWQKPPKFAMSRETLESLKVNVRGCITRLSERSLISNSASSCAASVSSSHSNGILSSSSSSSCSSSSQDQAIQCVVPVEDNDDGNDSADETEDDDDHSQDYVLPCCRAVWTPGVAYSVVECNRCKDWSHMGLLGKCPGESVTLRTARCSKYYHLCRKCSRKE